MEKLARSNNRSVKGNARPAKSFLERIKITLKTRFIGLNSSLQLKLTTDLLSPTQNILKLIIKEPDWRRVA